MNVISPSLETEYQKEYVASQNLHDQMVMKGHQTYEIGPVCSRDHAYNLRDLKAAAAAFLKVLPEPPESTPEYRRLKQSLHSQINQTP
jgi:hypothetical protein